MTGLPIDFQIQQQTDANTRYQGCRSALFSHVRSTAAGEMFRSGVAAAKEDGDGE